MPRTVRLLTLLALVACGSSSSSSPPAAAEPVDASAPPDEAAAKPPAADPTGWRKTGSLKTARLAHTASLLADGTVLVAGGEDQTRDMIASCEMFDPATQAWSGVEALPRHDRITWP